MRRSSAYPWTYWASWFAGAKAREQFSHVRRYVMFIGHPRSGTSLVGSMLNAHRHVRLAHELNALRYVKRGYNRNQLFWLLQQRDLEFGESGRNWTGYDYRIPGQWQGRTEELRVIGDKKAGAASELIGRNPRLLVRLRELVQVPIRMVHVIRNPFNVITTIHRKRRNTSLETSIKLYFNRCRTNDQLWRDPDNDVLNVHLETLIKQPVEALTQTCRFIGVESPPDFLSACQEKLFGAPNQSQLAVAWPRPLVDSVLEQMRHYEWLDGYRFLGRFENVPTTRREAA